MGRLKRYKKIKAFDPFAKKSKGTLPIVGKSRAKYDLSPDETDQKKKKRAKRSHGLDLNNEDDLEKFYQQEALKDIERAKSGLSIEQKLKKIEEKRDDETMREFKLRLRQATREALRDEFKKSSSTAIKRKERLKVRKLKREGKKVPIKRREGSGNEDEDSGDDDEVDPNEDFEAIEREFLKNKADARERDAILNKTARVENPEKSHKFLGSTDNNFNAPPDLTLFKIKMKGAPKTIDLKSTNINNSISNISKFQMPAAVADPVKLSKNQQKKENRLKFDSFLSSSALDDSSGLNGMMSYSGADIMQSNIKYRNSNSNGKASAADELRNQAINAYRDLKAKKRNAFSSF